MSLDTLQLWFTFTKDGGDNPATGLELSKIKLWLTGVHRLTGQQTIIWDGNQEPEEEIHHSGTYVKFYYGNLDLYHYASRAKYTGDVEIDSDWVVANIAAKKYPITEENCWFY